MKKFSKIIACMFILTNLFFYCSVAKADDSDTNIIELYDYETGQTSNVYIPNSGTSFLPASGIKVIIHIQQLCFWQSYMIQGGSQLEQVF